jgi:2-C-methyl-D-erythritol 4-phosphate cytidylyltransferase/2-C-methyl-D-erythritol 2,4-cyclodiphosphate synthase
MSKDTSPSFHLLIPAAGNGSRTGLSIPKQYQKIGGKMILRHTIEKFLNIQSLKSICVIIDPTHTDLYREAVQGLDLAPPVHGSNTRKRSVYNGLTTFSESENNDLILIHDAARPFISTASIHSILDAMKTTSAATLAAPITDTLVDRDYNRLDREKISAVQTPQAFRLGLLKRAHEAMKDNDNFTDDAGLVAALGETVTLVPGPRDNFKITTSEDMLMAERLLAPATETRTGFGYDVHAFDPAPSNKIRLGGIDIPHTQKLLGHSDADVILHAVTDAILGAIGEGDIGQLFPPSDMQWKNADSAIFVKEALRRLQAKSGKIINIDITLIAEAPKIGPHRDRMLDRLSEILKLDKIRIGLKATTSEGLGFTGRKEGIVAQAVANVSLPI